MGYDTKFRPLRLLLPPDRRGVRNLASGAQPSPPRRLRATLRGFGNSPGGDRAGDFQAVLHWRGIQIYLEEVPSRYCKWTVSLNKRALVWDKMEKFCNYVNWLEYLISHFFAVWGVQLNGTINWKGANRGNQGTITVKNKKIRVEMPLARADSPRAPAP
jgi:hypothetical protein